MIKICISDHQCILKSFSLNPNAATKEQWIWFALGKHCDSVEVLTRVDATCVGGSATSFQSNDLTLKVFSHFKIADIVTAGAFDKSSIVIAVGISFSSCLAGWMAWETFWSTLLQFSNGSHISWKRLYLILRRSESGRSWIKADVLMWQNGRSTRYDSGRYLSIECGRSWKVPRWSKMNRSFFKDRPFSPDSPFFQKRDFLYYHQFSPVNF